MEQEWHADLDRLRSMAEQLNAATAEAGAVVRAVDQFLGEELALGVSAATRPFDSQPAAGEDGRGVLVTSHLAYGRVAGQDRLYVLRATLETDEWKEEAATVVAEERTPWADGAREVKLQSFALLPELLGILAGRVEEVALRTARTVAQVRGLLDALRRRPEEPHPDPIPPPHSPSPDRDLDPEPATSPVPLHELSIHAAPGLFKRPRPK